MSQNVAIGHFDGHSVILETVRNTKFGHEFMMNIFEYFFSTGGRKAKKFRKIKRKENE